MLQPKKRRKKKLLFCKALHSLFSTIFVEKATKYSGGAQEAWEWEGKVVYVYFSLMKHTESQKRATGTKPVTLSVPPKSAFGKVACYAYGMKNYILEKYRK